MGTCTKITQRIHCGVTSLRKTRTSCSSFRQSDRHSRSASNNRDSYLVVNGMCCRRLLVWCFLQFGSPLTRPQQRAVLAGGSLSSSSSSSVRIVMVFRMLAYSACETLVPTAASGGTVGPFSTLVAPAEAASVLVATIIISVATKIRMRVLLVLTLGDVRPVMMLYRMYVCMYGGWIVNCILERQRIRLLSSVILFL